MADEQNTNQNAQTEQKAPIFEIVRVYNKNISVETPNVPKIFRKQEQPSTEIQMNLAFDDQIDPENHIIEATLRFTVTTKIGDEVGYLVEVEQAGLFRVENLEGFPLAHTLNVVCPTMLFPYVRETISSLINKLTFPPLNLQPIDFNGLFMQQMQAQEQKAREAVANNEAQA